MGVQLLVCLSLVLQGQLEGKVVNCFQGSEADDYRSAKRRDHRNG
jgi:hypothetical protein